MVLKRCRPCVKVYEDGKNRNKSEKSFTHAAADKFIRGERP